MNKSYFSSAISSSMSEFVKFKQCSGFDYRAQAGNLRFFDYFCVQNGIGSQVLTAEIVNAYRASLNGVAPNTLRSRMNALKKFSEYHNIFHKGSFVISKINIRVPPARKAYIYRDEEITQILAGLREYTSRDSFRASTYYMIGGLIAFTGARIQEVLNLRIKEWNSERQTLFIKKGKFGKDRLIPVKADVAEKIRTYLCLRMKYARGTSEEYLFVNSRKNKIGYSCFRTAFSSVLLSCGIDGSKQPFTLGPSIHSLRHTFAVQTIIRWEEEGKNINSMLPHLAVYLGHQGIEATQTYLQSTRELKSVGADKFHGIFNKNTLKKGHHHE